MTQQTVLYYVFGCVLAVDVLLLLVWGYRRLVLDKPTFAPMWSVVDVWSGAQIALFLTVLAASVFGIVFVSTTPSLSKVPDEKFFEALMTSPRGLLIFVVPVLLFQNLFLFTISGAFIVFKYRRRLRDIGLPPLPRARDIYAGILIGLFVFILTGILQVVLQGLTQPFRQVEWVDYLLQYEKNNPVAQIARALPQWGFPAFALALLVVSVAAPLGEEMLFRGFLFNALRWRFGLKTGLVVSALLFAIVHSYAIGLLVVFLMAVILAWVYHNSGSLWTAIVLHATNNALTLLIVFLFPSLAS